MLAFLHIRTLQSVCGRRYITVQELDSVPSYMRSRLTLEKVRVELCHSGHLAGTLQVPQLATVTIAEKKSKMCRHVCS